MKITIGRIDKADFPKLILEDIDLKIDSGAYTSSIHCSDIEEITIDNESFIKFTLLDPEHPFYNNKEYLIKIIIIKKTPTVHCICHESADFTLIVILSKVTSRSVIRDFSIHHQRPIFN